VEGFHKTNPLYKKEKQKERFMIKHSAKDVIYDIREFIDRNVDEISASLDAYFCTKIDKTVS